MLERMKHLPSTMMGTGIGAVCAGLAYWVMSQMHCDPSLMNWSAFVAYAVPQVQGLFSK